MSSALPPAPPVAVIDSTDSGATLHEVTPSTSSTLMSPNGTVKTLYDGMPVTSSTISSSSAGTVVGDASAKGISTLPNNPLPPSTRWVPDPMSPDESKRARTLVLCFDGTGDQFDDDNSNVVKFMSFLKKDDQRHQMVYYQTGIGTYTKNNFVSPLTTQISKILDEMFAWNLASHVQGGYEFLMQNYTAGDKISIFGFSRGAYTARALAGMIQKVGLLPACNIQQIPFAWAMYAREDADGLLNSEGFKKAFSIDVEIDFIGVWDTVASVGLSNKELPFVASNSCIRAFRHAVALDEHRVKFIPNFYHVSPKGQPQVATSSTDLTSNIKALNVSETLPPLGDGSKATKRKKLHEFKTESERWQAKINAEKKSKPTDALEVWFAGCHCDVGGGSVRNNTRYALARIPLRWMIRECFRAETGIIFDKQMLQDVLGMNPDTLYPEVKDRPERLKATKGMQIELAEAQPWPLVTFLKFVGGLVVIPLQVLFNIVTWPIKHVWLLLKFSPCVKMLRGAFSKPKTSSAPQVDAATAVADPSHPIKHDEPFTSEEDEELHDALSPIYDQLAINWYWWIVEWIPMRFRSQKGIRDDFYVRANFGTGRKIYGDALVGGLMVHRSVKTRLEVLDKTGKSAYAPLAWFKKKDPVTHRKVEGPKSWNVEESNDWKWVS